MQVVRPIINRNNYKEFRKMSAYTKNGKRMYNLEYSVGGIVKYTWHDADDFDRIAQGHVAKAEQVKPIKRDLTDNEKFFKQIEAEYQALDKHKTYIKVWIKYRTSNWEHIMSEHGFKVLVGKENTHTKEDFAVVHSSAPLTPEELLQSATQAQDKLAEKLEQTTPGDYYVANILERNYRISTLKEINENTKNPMYIKMHSGKPIEYMFLGSPVFIPKTPGYCTPEALMMLYGKTKKEKEKDRIPGLTLALLKEILGCKETQGGVDTDKIQTAFCEHYGVSHYALDARRRVYWKWVSPVKSNYPALIYYNVDAHMHPITSKKIRDSITKSNADRGTTSGYSASSLLTTQTDDSDEKVQERIERFKMPYFVDVQVSKLNEYANCNIFYHTLNLHEIVVDIFCKYNVMPKITFQGAHVSEVEYKNNVRLYRNPNHKSVRKSGEGLDWEDTKILCTRFRFPFKNQSITSLTRDIHKTFFNDYGSVREARKNLPKMEREMVCIQQNNKCNHCKKNAIQEYDHIKPVCAGGSSTDFDNWQGLCKECHNQKTALENAERIFHIDNSISSWNVTTKAIFQKPKSALIHHFRDKDTVNRDKTVRTFGFDLTKCRKNIVLNNKFDYPVYSALDDVKVFDIEKLKHIPIGEYYVHTGNLIPFKGNGWYSYVLVRFALEKNIIALEDITHAVLPSLHVRAESYNKFINHVYEKAGDDELAKMMINSWVGSLGTKETERRSLYFTRSGHEASYLESKDPEHIRVDTCTPETVEKFHQVWSVETIKQNDSYAPIYNQILDMEAIELHKITQILKSLGGEIVYVNTDNAIAQFPIKNFPEDTLNKIAQTTFWDDEKKVLKYKIESILKSKSRNMQTISTAEYVYEKPVWNDLPDPGHNDFKAVAKMHVDSGKGVSLGGAPGVGKTTMAKEMIAELRRQKKKFLLLAPTNKSAVVLHKDAVTIDSIFASKGNKCSIYKQMSKYDYIVVDEQSMIHEIFWRLFLDIKRNTKCLFVCLGDWTQLPPVQDRAKFDYRNSSVMNVLCDNNRMILTVCRRSDRRLFDLYMQDNLLAKVDTKAYGKKLCERSLTFRNAKRKEINKKWMDTKIAELNEDDYFFVEKHDRLHQSQDMYVYIGLPVMSILTNKKLGIANGESFAIKEISDKLVTLNTWVKVEDKKELEEIIRVIPRAEVSTYLVPAYCLTVHKIQGETFDFPYSIVGWKEMNQTLRYVALSRGTKLENLNFID
jgi:5-methylcytosine-specific restriction endonuclease McrA